MLFGRNTTILPSRNNQGAISVYATMGRTISIDGYYSSGEDRIRALIYSGSDVDTSGDCSVSFGRGAGPKNKAFSKSVGFSDRIAYTTDEQ